MRIEKVNRREGEERRREGEERRGGGEKGRRREGGGGEKGEEGAAKERRRGGEEEGGGVGEKRGWSEKVEPRKMRAEELTVIPPLPSLTQEICIVEECSFTRATSLGRSVERPETRCSIVISSQSIRRYVSQDQGRLGRGGGGGIIAYCQNVHLNDFCDRC